MGPTPILRALLLQLASWATAAAGSSFPTFAITPGERLGCVKQDPCLCELQHRQTQTLSSTGQVSLFTSLGQA